MSKVITKAELIAEVARQAGKTKTTVAEVLEWLEVAAKAALKDGSAVIIPGLVKLTPKDRAPRIGRNPATGESVSIPAKSVVNAKAVSTILA